MHILSLVMDAMATTLSFTFYKCIDFSWIVNAQIVTKKFPERLIEFSNSCKDKFFSIIYQLKMLSLTQGFLQGGNLSVNPFENKSYRHVMPCFMVSHSSGILIAKRLVVPSMYRMRSLTHLRESKTSKNHHLMIATGMADFPYNHQMSRQTNMYL